MTAETLIDLITDSGISAMQSINVVVINHWTLWNHVRTAAALAAVASFTLALRRLP